MKHYVPIPFALFPRSCGILGQAPRGSFSPRTASAAASSFSRVSIVVTFLLFGRSLLRGPAYTLGLLPIRRVGGISPLSQSLSTHPLHFLIAIGHPTPRPFARPLTEFLLSSPSPPGREVQQAADWQSYIPHTSHREPSASLYRANPSRSFRNHKKCRSPFTQPPECP